jgi:N utilization substance protein B
MSRPPSASVLNKRRAARLAAVQALYQLELTGGDAAGVVREFGAHRLAELFEPFEMELPSPAVDRAWFERIVTGAWGARERLDPAIAEALAEGWSLERCGFLLRACLRAGTFELADCPDVPMKVVINEYIEVARLFFGGGEAAFVNAALDRLAHRIRTREAVP